MGRLDGKVALITGGSMGLGEADARLFKSEGAQVVIADINAEAGENVAKEIDATYIPLDVTSEEQWAGVIETIKGQFGRLDILVNNAGIVEVGNILTTSTDAWRRVNAVSSDGTFFGCRASIPLMIESGGGSIVNMASIASMQGEHYVTAYCAAKGAVEAITRAIACWGTQENNGIRCNSIHPAGIDTPMVASMGQKMAEANMQRSRPAATSGDSAGARGSRLGQPIDIAYMALYLASDESMFVNGAAMKVDNTMTITTGVVPDFG
ncbi:MAG: SDR family oxidoreductase [bacterium]|nr:SDR family oxidoreductase [Gammaproteobacteria bacterium]